MRWERLGYATTICPIRLQSKSVRVYRWVTIFSDVWERPPFANRAVDGSAIYLHDSWLTLTLTRVKLLPNLKMLGRWPRLVKKVHKRQKTAYDHKTKTPYQVGERVFVYMPAAKATKAYKFASNTFRMVKICIWMLQISFEGFELAFESFESLLNG